MARGAEVTVRVRAAPRRTRVLVVVRVRLYRQGLNDVLAAEPRLDVVGSVGSGGEAVSAIASADPDVVLLDMGVPGASSLATHLARHGGPPHVVALGIEETEDAVIAFAEAGVEAFVDANAGMADLTTIVEAASRGELVCSPRVAVILRRRVASMGRPGAPAGGEDVLTARERDVAALIDAGLSNREIAARLTIEVSTVKNHVRSIFDKLGVNRRSEVGLRFKGDGGGPSPSPFWATGTGAWPGTGPDAGST
jgi:two-component system, NarL family, nitrate/nitrite response regulator NarL